MADPTPLRVVNGRVRRRQRQPRRRRSPRQEVLHRSQRCPGWNAAARRIQMHEAWLERGWERGERLTTVLLRPLLLLRRHGEGLGKLQLIAACRKQAGQAAKRNHAAAAATRASNALGKHSGAHHSSCATRRSLSGHCWAEPQAGNCHGPLKALATWRRLPSTPPTVGSCFSAPGAA